MVEILFFDIDNTLYAPEINLMEKIDKKIVEYLIKYIEVKPNKVDRLRKYYYESYGSTLNGLIQERRINAKEYLEYIHNVNEEDLPKKDSRLISMLDRLACRKSIITNSYLPYAKRVLCSIGIVDRFENIHDTVFMEYQYKNSSKAIQKVLDFYKIDARRVALIDDNLDSLITAKKMGVIPIFIKCKKENSAEIEYEIDSIYDLEKLIKEKGLTLCQDFICGTI